VAPARALDRNAPPVARAAPPVRRIASDSHMYPVFLLLASAATRPFPKRRVSARSCCVMSENWEP
jgi:hypothetical protein